MKPTRTFVAPIPHSSWCPFCAHTEKVPSQWGYGLGEDDGRADADRSSTQLERRASHLDQRQGDTAERCWVCGWARTTTCQAVLPRGTGGPVESVLRRSKRSAAAAQAPAVSGEEPTEGLHVDERTREVQVEGSVELHGQGVRPPGLSGPLTPPGVQPGPAAPARVGSVRMAGRGHGHRARPAGPPQGGDDPEHPRWITTVRGVGYRFEP